MKQLLLCASLITFLFLGSGCTVNKDFSFDIDYDLPVNQPAGTTYSTTKTVKASEYSSDFDKYKDDISNVDVESATYTILSATPASPAQTIQNATLTVADLSGGSPVVVSTVSNINLASSIGVESPLPLTDAGKQKIEDQLRGSEGAATFTFTGMINEAPTVFTVKFKLHLKATYSKTIP
jgi:hypothetical protein